MRKRKLPERNPLRKWVRAHLARVPSKSCGMKSSSLSRWGWDREGRASNLGGRALQGLASLANSHRKSYFGYLRRQANLLGLLRLSRYLQIHQNRQVI